MNNVLAVLHPEKSVKLTKINHNSYLITDSKIGNALVENKAYGCHNITISFS